MLWSNVKGKVFDKNIGKICFPKIFLQNKNFMQNLPAQNLEQKMFQEMLQKKGTKMIQSQKMPQKWSETEAPASN